MTQHKVTIEFYTSNLEDIPEKIPGIKFKFHGTSENLGNFLIEGTNFTVNIDKPATSEEQDCLMYDSEDLKENELDYQVKNVTFVPGVLCMSFKEGCPVKYTVATFTQYVRNDCTENWLESLQNIVADLKMTNLYVVGKKQKMLIQDYVLNVPINIWRKPPVVSYCPKCSLYGCSQFKTKLLLHDIYNQKLSISCE